MSLPALVAACLTAMMIASAGLTLYVSIMVNRLFSRPLTALVKVSWLRAVLEHLRIPLVMLLISSVLAAVIGIYLYYVLYQSASIVSELEEIFSMLTTQ